jgi:UDP-glucuronate 4-epimerase
MSTILVTGVAGFIGSHVCEKLLQQGHTVVGVDAFLSHIPTKNLAVLRNSNIQSILPHPHFFFHQVDIRDYETLRRTLISYDISGIIHLAAYAGVRASFKIPNDYITVNVEGTLNLFRLMSNELETVESIVIASTSSVYGDNATLQRPILETDSTDFPLAPYPASKRSAELLAYTYWNHWKKKKQVSIARLFSVYGPRGRRDMMPFQIADSIHTGNSITLFDGGEMWRDWTYVEDIVSGLLLMLEKSDGYQIYNLGRGEPVRMADFVKILEAHSGSPANIISRPAPPSEPKITFASTEKAQRLLGYQPQVSVHQGLAKFWQWFSQQAQSLS